jgi:hypothetical protein
MSTCIAAGKLAPVHCACCFLNVAAWWCPGAAQLVGDHGAACTRSTGDATVGEMPACAAHPCLRLVVIASVSLALVRAANGLQTMCTALAILARSMLKQHSGDALDE